MLDAHRVVFNGFDSENFDLTPHLSFDSDSGNTTSYLGRDSIHTESYDGARRRIHRYKYNEVCSPTITLIKTNFSDLEDDEHRRILSWLTATDKPGWFQVFKDDSNVLSFQIWGNVINVEDYKLGNGRVVGVVVSIEGNAPYTFSSKLTYPVVRVEGEINNDETNDYAIVQGTSTFTITCNTDEYNKPIYPKIIIKFSDTDIYFDVAEDLSTTYSTYDMIPHTIYRDKNNTLYVNLNKENHKGRFSIQDLVSITVSPASFDLLNQYQYFSEDKTIKKCIGETVNDNAVYHWETIVKVGASVKINNTIVTGASLNEEIIIDGENKIISSLNINEPRIIGDDFNWEWPTLTYGENNIVVTGNCTIKFEWLEPRKVGSL